MNEKIKVVILLSITFIIFILVYFPKGSVKTDIPVYRKAVYYVPKKLDPFSNSFTSVHSILGLVYEGLFTVNKFLEVVPVLVDEWKVNKDGTIYHFQLKKNILFHDKTQMTSEDVVNSLKEVMEKSIFLKSSLKRIVDLRKINTYEFEIKLNSPYPPFLSLLSAPMVKIYKKDKNNIYQGTGPFIPLKFEKYHGKKSFLLKQNPDYHLGPPKIQSLQLVELKETDLRQWVVNKKIHDTSNFSASPVLVKDMTNARTYENPSAMTWIITFNLTKEKLGSLKLRKCLDQNLDKEKFTQQFLNGHGVATGFVPPTLMGGKVKPRKREKNCEFEKKIQLNLDIPKELSYNKKMCEFVKANYKKMNVEITCSIMTFDELVGRIIKKKSELALFAWALDYPDVENFFLAFEPETKIKIISHSSPHIVNLLERARQIPDRLKRAKIYQEVNQYIYDNVFTLNISYSHHYFVMHKCLVGFDPNIMGDIYFNYANISLKKDCNRYNDFL